MAGAFADARSSYSFLPASMVAEGVPLSTPIPSSWQSSIPGASGLYGGCDDHPPQMPHVRTPRRSVNRMYSGNRLSQLRLVNGISSGLKRLVAASGRMANEVKLLNGSPPSRGIAACTS